MRTMAAEEAPLPRTVLTRAQLAERIARGDVLVVHRRLIYKLNNWIHQHPGGDLAILHFVGRDARDEIEVYHSDETIRMMRRFAIAQLAPEEATDLAQGRIFRPLMPPVQLGYRHGKLDHPHAQLDVWDAAPREGARVQTFPLPVDLLEPPPTEVTLEREARISARFEALHQQVKDAGMYTLRPQGYARECVRYLLFAVGAYGFFQAAARYGTVAYLASAVCLGALWHQVAFTAHDAGHTGITHIYWVDRLIGVLVASYVGGLSLVWWCDNHDIHHLVTNHPEHDPDIQHMPIFAISPRFLPATWRLHKKTEDGAQPRGLWSSYYRRVMEFDGAASTLLRYQHQLYFAIMSVARFNLYFLSYSFLFLKARRDVWFWFEAIGLAVFWYWFPVHVLGNLPSWPMCIGYLLVSHIVTSPLHVQIVLSHFAQDTRDLGPYECFASRQIRTTMDVACPRYLDWFHGGLHMQVAHHLFPRLPRHNLRETRDRFVKPFCDANGLVYEELTFTRGNGKVVARLKEIADQVRILYCVANAQARGAM